MYSKVVKMLLQYFFMFLVHTSSCKREVYSMGPIAIFLCKLVYYYRIILGLFLVKIIDLFSCASITRWEVSCTHPSGMKINAKINLDKIIKHGYAVALKKSRPYTVTCSLLYFESLGN